MNPGLTSLQRYNALDCCATLELLNTLLPQLDETSSFVYDRQREMQGPALAMMTRGILMNTHAMRDLREKLGAEMATLRSHSDYLARGLGFAELNPQSSAQIGKIFTALGVKPHKKFDAKTKEYRVTWDRNALDKIILQDPEIAPWARIITDFRDRKKDHEVMSTRTRNGRLYTSFHIAGTNTFRWSSDTSAFWDGCNFQNIKEDLRSAFIADPGYRLLNIDLATGDNRMVALDLFMRLGDPRYLDACEGGDVHTNVAKVCWPELPWTGDPKEDRAIAETLFYRHFSYRFMCKRIGHGTNYLGEPTSLSRQSQCPIEAIRIFQPKYFAAFGVDIWQEHVINDLQLNHALTNIFGYRRYFHGRVSNSDTWREAAGYLGQSGTACACNKGVLRIFNEVPKAQLLNQIHDAALLQYKIEDEPWIVDKVLSCFNNPITVRAPNGQSRSHTVPVDASVGYNWGKASKENPDGLKDWRGAGTDTRERRYDPAASLLDRCLR